MKDGGPAFPVQDMRGDEHGMSMRDYFAGQALAGVCQRADWDDGEENVLARWAYDIADAMLAEREKEPVWKK